MTCIPHAALSGVRAKCISPLYVCLFRKNILSLVVFAVFFSWIFTSPVKVEAVEFWCVVDHHTRPLPGSPPDGWYYNQTGGDRGCLLDFGDDPIEGVAVYSKPGPSTYKGEIVRLIGDDLWKYLGFWYALGHPISEKASFDPQAAFHPMILPTYQARLTGLDVTVAGIESPAGREDLALKVDLNGFNAEGDEVNRASWRWSGRDSLLSGPFPKTFSAEIDPALLGNIGVLVCVLERAVEGDAVEIDRVRLQVEMPKLSTAEEAFVVSLAMLLENYDESTGMVQDRTCFPKGDFENVTSTGKLAKLLAIASRFGYVDEIRAQNAVVKMADTLLNIVPRGPEGIDSLWPHFTRNGGAQRIEDVEWASGDTAYALLDLIVALQMTGDPASQLASAIQMLKAIDWQALQSPDGGFHHGYNSEGEMLTGVWTGFGMETLGVLLAALAGDGLPGTMGPPPSDNGSGFIYHAGYPVVPTGIDRWGNNWLVLRREESERQVGWYSDSNHPNPFLAQMGIFGLSAAESPMGWDADPALIYQAYGTGGRYSPAHDGGRTITVLHYSGMVADLQRAASEQMWNRLKQLGILSPLSSMESMAVNPVTGAIEQVNFMKGSWNLCLQAEGWALSLPNVAQSVYRSFLSVPELALAYRTLFPETPATERIIVSDGARLISIPADQTSDESVLTETDTQFSSPRNPVTVDHRWVWFDAVNEALAGQNRRGLWRKDIFTGEVQRMTTDPYGNSYDEKPIPSPFHPGVLYLSNRSGLPRLKFACGGTQGPGFGTDVYAGEAAAVWKRNVSEAQLAYVASRQSANHFAVYHVSCAEIFLDETMAWDSDGDIFLAGQRLDLSADGSALLMSTLAGGIFVKRLPSGDVAEIHPTGHEACFNSDGTKIAFVDIPAGDTDFELYTADIGEDGSLGNINRLTYNDREDRHPTWQEIIYAPCAGDIDLDGDVDGLDTAELANDSSLLDLSIFTLDFGNTDCR